MTDEHSNHYYNKNLQPYANSLRKEMIKAGGMCINNCLRNIICKHTS